MTNRNRRGGRADPVAEDLLREALAQSRSVFVAGGMAYPTRLVEWINQNPSSSEGKELVFAQPAGFSQPPVRALGGRVRVFFLLPGMAEFPEYEFVSMQYRRTADWLAQPRRFDLVLAAVGRKAEASYSLGLGVDFVPPALASGARCLAEVNEALGEAYGAPRVEASRIEVAAVSNQRPPALTTGATDEVSRAIGGHVAGLVRDGDCLQLGVGGIPEAVLAALGGHRRLGVHSGLVSDGVLELVEKGVITGERKTIDRSLLVAGFLLGSERLYQWAQRAQQLRLRPVNYTHDARVLSELERLVSINSAVEVDLQGQVNAERIRGRQSSGVGGSIDFMRAAARSPGGRSIIAMPATAAGGKVSRIVGNLAAVAVVTAARSDVDCVVTEHGVAHLYGATDSQRRERLMAIAAPQFREQLAR